MKIHCSMKFQYGKTCLSMHQMYEWGGKFKNVVSDVMDAAQPGQVQRESHNAAGSCGD
jgi:hypothetical protein